MKQNLGFVEYNSVSLNKLLLTIFFKLNRVEVMLGNGSIFLFLQLPQDTGSIQGQTEPLLKESRFC
jgi:hypothetical protein